VNPIVGHLKFVVFLEEKSITRWLKLPLKKIHLV
jgi:hypothetical protein